MILGIVSSLVSLALPALIVVGIVLAVRRNRSPQAAGEPGLTGHSVRRFFQYLLLLGLLIVAASGLSGLLASLLDFSDVLFRGDADLALQLTFAFIGLPLFALLGWWSLRRLRSDPAEVRSLGWAFYLTVATVVALAMTMSGLYQTLVAVLGVSRWDGSGLATALVWGAAWALHRWAARHTPVAHLRLLHLAGSLIGLGVAVTGLVQLVGASLSELLGLRGDSLVGEPLDPLLRAAALTLVGALVWVYYWLRTTAGSPRDAAWLAYVLLAGVGGGLVVALTAGSLMLYDVLVWLVGDPRASSATEHFDGTPTLLGAALVGALVWWYHQSVLGTRREEHRSEVRRVYEYLMAGIALVAASAGVTMVLVTLVESLAGGGGVVVGSSSVNTLLAALTLLGVGLPVWWWHWRLAQRAVATDPAGEVVSPTRRIFLVVLFGVVGIVAVVALLVGVYLLLEDVLGDGFDGETARRTRFALGILVSATLVSAYHWNVFRSDREHAPAPVAAPAAAVPRGHVLLVGAADATVADELARRTGATVQLVRRTDEGALPWSVDDLVAAVDGDARGDLVVISEAEGLRVIPVAR